MVNSRNLYLPCGVIKHVIFLARNLHSVRGYQRAWDMLKEWILLLILMDIVAIKWWISMEYVLYNLMFYGGLLWESLPMYGIMELQ